MVKKPKARKPMPKPSRPMPSKVELERRRRFNAYLNLWRKMQDREGAMS